MSHTLEVKFPRLPGDVLYVIMEITRIIMTEPKECPTCLGLKEFRSPGNIMIQCPACRGTGQPPTGGRYEEHIVLVRCVVDRVVYGLNVSSPATIILEEENFFVQETGDKDVDSTIESNEYLGDNDAVRSIETTVEGALDAAGLELSDIDEKIGFDKE